MTKREMERQESAFARKLRRDEEEGENRLGRTTIWFGLVAAAIFAGGMVRAHWPWIKKFFNHE
jgi:hypothetical protein